MHTAEMPLHRRFVIIIYANTGPDGPTGWHKACPYIDGPQPKYRRPAAQIPAGIPQTPAGIFANTGPDGPTGWHGACPYIGGPQSK